MSDFSGQQLQGWVERRFRLDFPTHWGETSRATAVWHDRWSTPDTFGF
jgi:hypothetical protein